MVDPVGFLEAWRAQFPESDPPRMELRSMGDIEQELDRCKSSIKHLEQEVNKERFRMIYLQTLLAKERKSYHGRRWGFQLTSQEEAGEQQRGAEKVVRCPSEGVEPPGRQAGGSVEVPVVGGGSSVAALRSNFERLRRAKSHSGGEDGGLAAAAAAAGQQRPCYVNMEFHQQRALVKVNDRHVSARISSLGCQALMMDRRRSPLSLPGNLSAVAGGGASDAVNGSCEVLAVVAAPQSSGPACQPYTSVYVGGMMGSEEEELHLTWPRPCRSPLNVEDTGGGGYTPDCSSNENLTSSEEDFSSEPSRLKSRSPSQQSLDSGSPPTPLSHRGAPSSQQAQQPWPGDGNSTTSSETSHGSNVHGDRGRSSRSRAWSSTPAGGDSAGLLHRSETPWLWFTRCVPVTPRTEPEPLKMR